VDAGVDWLVALELGIAGNAADCPDGEAGGAGDLAVAHLGAEHFLDELELREREGRHGGEIENCELQISNCKVGND
jgi:hypothetical protein